MICPDDIPYLETESRFRYGVPEVLLERGSRQRQLLRLRGGMTFRAFDVTADGQEIIVAEQVGDQDIITVVVQNWIKEFEETP